MYMTRWQCGGWLLAGDVGGWRELNDVWIERKLLGDYAVFKGNMSIPYGGVVHRPVQEYLLVESSQ